MRERGVTAEPPPRWAILPPRSDARLTRLAAAGDPRAFACIYERYHEEIYRFCCALLGDSHEAQDALQNTMASALASLPGDGRRIALRPWLFRVARNECVSILRRRQQLVEPELLDGQPAPDAAEDAARRARLGELIRDLRALGERQRAALLMRELAGLGYAEIAAALDVSPQAARQAVYEARTALLEMGEGRGMECEQVQRALSERDGRRLRARRYRAHLRECARCAEFEAALARRPEDLGALFPVPPGLGSVALGGSLAAGKAAGGAAPAVLGGGSVGGALGVGSGAKLAATVAAVGALGLGAAGIERAVDRSSDEPKRDRSAASAPGGSHGQVDRGGAVARAGSTERVAARDSSARPRGGPRKGRERAAERGASDRAGRGRGGAPEAPRGWRAAKGRPGHGRSGGRGPDNGGGPPASVPGRGPAGAPGRVLARGKSAAAGGRGGSVRRDERAQPAPQAPAGAPPADPEPGKATGKDRGQSAHGSGE